MNLFCDSKDNVLCSEHPLLLGSGRHSWIRVPIWDYVIFSHKVAVKQLALDLWKVSSFTIAALKTKRQKPTRGQWQATRETSLLCFSAFQPRGGHSSPLWVLSLPSGVVQLWVAAGRPGQPAELSQCSALRASWKLVSSIPQLERSAVSLVDDDLSMADFVPMVLPLLVLGLKLITSECQCYVHL